MVLGFMFAISVLTAITIRDDDVALPIVNMGRACDARFGRKLLYQARNREIGLTNISKTITFFENCVNWFGLR